MIIVAGLWENGWLNSNVEYQQYKHVMKAYGVDKFLMAPIEVVKQDDSFPVEQHDTMEEILESFGNIKKCFLEWSQDFEDNGIPHVDLKDYEHPKDVMYVLGKSGTNNCYLMTEDDDAVSIVAPNNDYSLWGVTVIGIVLYDRMMKS